jgi:hypothetical protein
LLVNEGFGRSFSHLPTGRPYFVDTRMKLVDTLWEANKSMDIPFRRRLLLLVVALASLSALLDGCASSRLIKNPPPPGTDVGWAASGPGGITLEVHQLIFRDSGGSWVKKANWDEYVLTVENDSQDVVEIQSFYLYSDKLPAPVESSTSREQLDARSNSTLQALKGVGIVASVGIVAPSAMIVGALGTSGGALSASSGAAAVAAVGFVAIPVGLIGGTVYVINRHRQNKKDKLLIDQQLNERGYGVPLQIQAQTQVTKSAFFPITPAPTRLVLNYSTHGEAREISLELPELAGLHLKAPKKAPRPVSAAIPGAP